MKFISKDAVLEFEITGTKIKARPMGMTAQTDYLLIVSRDKINEGDEPTLESKSKTFTRKILENKDALDAMLVKYIITIEGYSAVQDALDEMADITEYIKLIGEVYNLSTLNKDETKN